MKSICKIVTSLAVAATLLSANPAHALSAWCPTLSFPVFVLQCTTLDVPANSEGNFIYYEVSSFVSYRVHDHVTGESLEAGDSGAFGHRGLIFGLTRPNGSYDVTIFSIAAGWAYISNT